MTLDSDDDTPRSPSPPPVLSSRNKPTKAPAAPPPKPAAPALKPTKPTKLTKKQRQKQKRADVAAASDLDDADADDEPALTTSAADPDGAKMDKGFVFDNFGGGFVGRDRNSVWVRPLSPPLAQPASTRSRTAHLLQDSGEAYIQKRPNAMVRSPLPRLASLKRSPLTCSTPPAAPSDRRRDHRAPRTRARRRQGRRRGPGAPRRRGRRRPRARQRRRGRRDGRQRRREGDARPARGRRARL